MPSDKSAFTLTELLVVIAMLGIILVLLLPAIKQNNSRSLQIQCLMQNRQLALALQIYTHDHRDALAWPNWGNSFQGWLYNPTNDAPPAPSQPAEIAYSTGLLWPYIHAAKVYRCPVDSWDAPHFSERPQQLSSYVMNGAVMGYCVRPASSRTHKLPQMNPSAYAIWEPSDEPPCIPALAFNDGASYPINQQGPSARHGPGCNASSFDGHADFLKVSTFQREQLAKPSLLWSDPDTQTGTGGPSGSECQLWK